MTQPTTVIENKPTAVMRSVALCIKTGLSGVPTGWREDHHADKPGHHVNHSGHSQGQKLPALGPRQRPLALAAVHQTHRRLPDSGPPILWLDLQQ